MSRIDLLERVAGDLTGCRLHRAGGSTALVETADGPSCWWTVRTDRRRLLLLETSAFHVDGPATTADARVVLRHTGQLRRSGLRPTVKGPDHAAGEAIAEALLADGELEAAALPLDFTDFTITPVDGRWRAQLELMGGSHVRTVLPPASNYVRLAADQVAALLATVAVLHRRLPADPDRLRLPADPPVGRPDHQPDDPAGTDRHLPRRTT